MINSIVILNGASCHFRPSGAICHFERSGALCHSERSETFYHSEDNEALCHSERSEESRFFGRKLPQNDKKQPQTNSHQLSSGIRHVITESSQLTAHNSKLKTHSSIPPSPPLTPSSAGRCFSDARALYPGGPCCPRWPTRSSGDARPWPGCAGRSGPLGAMCRQLNHDSKS